MHSKKHLCAVCKHNTPLPCRCQHGEQRAHPRESGQFLCCLLMDIGPHRVAAARQARQHDHCIQRRYKRRHIGQQQPDRGMGRSTGQHARAHRKRRTAAAAQPQHGQRPAAGGCPCIAVKCAAVLVVAVQILFKVIEVGVLIFAPRHQTSPVRS